MEAVHAQADRMRGVLFGPHAAARAAAKDDPSAGGLSALGLSPALSAQFILMSSLLACGRFSPGDFLANLDPPRGSSPRPLPPAVEPDLPRPPALLAPRPASPVKRAAPAVGAAAVLCAGPLAVLFSDHQPSSLAAARAAAAVLGASSVELEACRLSAAILHDALAGVPGHICFRNRTWTGSPELMALADGGWRTTSPPDLRHTPDSLTLLSAALWASADAPDFATAIHRAMDVPGACLSGLVAVVGQLAGALHGARSIPQDWLPGAPLGTRLGFRVRDLIFLHYRTAAAARAAKNRPPVTAQVIDFTSARTRLRRA